MEPISQNTTSDAYLGLATVREIRKGPALIWKRPDVISYEYEFATSRNAIEAAAIPGHDDFKVTSYRKTYINGVFVKEEPLGFTVAKNSIFYSEIKGDWVTIRWEYNYTDGPIATRIDLVQTDSGKVLSLDFVQGHVPVCRISAWAGGDNVYAVSDKPVASDILIGLEITTWDNPDGSSDIWYDNLNIRKGETESKYNIPNSDIKIDGSIAPQHDNTYIYSLGY